MNAGDTRPTDRLEMALQASLRPVDPGVQFTASLQARLAAAEPRASEHPDPAPGRQSRWLYSASLPLAASIVVALAVGWQLQDLQFQRQAEQIRWEQARVQSQVMLALEITSERLGQVQQRIEQYQSQEKRL